MNKESQVMLNIFTDKKKVVIKFPVHITWLAFDPGQARALARLLNSRADEIDGGVN